MRIHIVNPYRTPAMDRMCYPLDSELKALYDVDTSTTIDPTADVNIHCPYHTLNGDAELGNGKHIAIYTHCNPGAEWELLQASQKADLITAMSFAGRQELLDYGVDPKKIWVVPCAADGFTFRPRKILVVGYIQPNGRKRESLLLDLAWKYDLTPFEFVLIGSNWEELAGKLASLGVKVSVGMALEHAQLMAAYQTADVFLVTGYMEGGPLPLLEAMASGVRVLSPRFGYAADLLEDNSLYDTPEELWDILSREINPLLDHHRLARAWSWKDYSAEYALLIGRLLGESVDVFPERGMSRYAQLLDIIDEIKPHSVCEIGTWNGNRAIQMLQAMGKYHPSKRLNYQGFDLFAEHMTGELFVRELSKVAQPQAIVEKRIQATGANVEFVAGDTFDTIDNMKRMDFYFVDGGHSENTIQNDGERVSSYVDEYGGVAVFDDYYHKNKPDGMGCNKFIDNLDPQHFEITHLPVRTVADDGREIGMVKVCRRINTNVSKDITNISSTVSSSWIFGGPAQNVKQ